MKAMKDNGARREAQRNTFDEVVDQARRRLLQGTGAATLLGFFASPAALARALDEPVAATSSLLAAFLATHPTAFSEWPHSQFHELGGGRPRSATLVIERADGKPVFAER